MIGQIKAVCFDLDNTLYDEASFYLSVVTATFPNLPISENRLYSQIKNLIRSDCLDLFSEVLKSLGLSSPLNHQKLFEKSQSICFPLSLKEASESTLKELRKSFKIAMLTNGNMSIQVNKIKNFQQAHLFDLICYARIHGRSYEKPHPVAFSQVSDGLNINPSEILFVGDSLERDIWGALNFGMDAILTTEFTDFVHIPPNIRRLSSINELVPILLNV